MESISLEPTETADAEKSKYGQRMEFDAAGPYQKTRSRTDFCWLILFIIYLVIWSIIIIYAFSVGDTSRFFKPSDSAGRTCALDSGVEDKPYLVAFKSDSPEVPYYWVCRSSCPEYNFEFEDVANGSTDSTAAATTEQVATEPPGDMNAQQQGDKPADASPRSDSELPKEPREEKQVTGSSEEPKKLPESRQKRDTRVEEETRAEQGVTDKVPESSTDRNGPSSTEPTMTTSRQATEENADSSTSNLEAKFTETKRRIICKSDVNLELVKSWYDLSYLVRQGHCSRSYQKADCQTNATSISYPSLDALSSSKLSIVGFVLLSGAVALLSIFLMRWHAMMYVCVTLFVSCALVFHFIYEECVLEAENKTSGVLLALFLGVVTLVAVVLLAIYFRREIVLACHMIEESTKAITCVLSSLAVPLVLSALFLLVCILGARVFFLLASLRSPLYRLHLDPTERCECPFKFGYSHNSSCEPDIFAAQCHVGADGGDACVRSGCYMLEQRDATVGFLHFVNVFGLVWLYWFVSGLNDTVLASVYSTWYWTFNKKILSYLSVVESFWRIGTYHLGTIVLGSLLIIVCKIIRAIFNCLEKSLRKTKNPISAAILANLLHCCGPAMEGFMRFINRRAYIMCAMHGTDFVQSARTAFYLLMRNCKRVIAVTAVTNRLTHITAVLIAGMTTRIAMSYYSSLGEEGLHERIWPLLLVGLGSYVMACMIMRVIEVAVDTVFLCFLEDTERNDGTNERPYFMSDDLTKFLYVK